MSTKPRKLRPRTQILQGRPGGDAFEQSTKIRSSPPSDSAELVNEQRKELRSWEVFKEENHAVLEQLPLSLHRQLKLIRELETQNEALHAELLSSVRRYIDLRRDIPQHSNDLKDVGEETKVAPMDLNGSRFPTSNDPTIFDGARVPNCQPKHGDTTRSLLQYISQVSEESLRAAEEKVSIAQAAYETVDRHIRLLDQAIKEQEAAISLGMRLGTHPAPILLPDIVAVPRWARPARVEHSPLSLTPEPDLCPENEPVISNPTSASPPLTSTKKSKKGSRNEPALQFQGELMLPMHATSSKTRSGMKLTALTPLNAGGQPTLVDQNEKAYCYCNQVSFGTMIACDNETCKLEWFHLGCTGLADLPGKRSKWYCRDCEPKMIRPSGQRS